MRTSWKMMLIGISLALIILLAAGCAKRQSAQEDRGTQQKLPQYTVASEFDYLPLEFVDPATNENTGFEIELMQAIGRAEGFEPVFRDTGFDDIVNAVQENRVDLGISAIVIEPELQRSVDFSVPYLKTGLIAAVAKDNDAIGSIDDLKGKPLVARVASTGADKCGELSSDVKHVDYVPDALSEVKKGGAVAVIDNMPITAYYVNQSPNDFKLVGDLISPKHYGIAVAKNEPDLLAKVNDGLNKLEASGEYATLYKKWFGRDPEPYLPGDEPK